MKLTPKVKDREELIRLLIEIFDVFAKDGHRLTFTELQIILFMLVADSPNADYNKTADRIPIMTKMRFSETGMSTHLGNLKKKGWLLDGKVTPWVNQLRTATFPFNLNMMIDEQPAGQKRP